MLGPFRRVTEVSRPKVVGPVTVGHGVNEFFSIVIPPIIPLLVTDFGITYGQAGFLLTIFFIMYSLFQLPAGILADWIGKRPMMIFGLLGMSGGILLAALSVNYEMLLVAQAITGISGSTFHPTGMSIISDVETGDTEGKAMGVFGFGGALGTMSSPLVVGGLAAFVSWRAALGGAALLGLAVTLASIVFLLRARSAEGDGSDASGDGTEDEHPDDSRPDGGDQPHGEPRTDDGDSEPDEPRTDGGRSSSIRGLFGAARELVNVPITRGIVLLFFVTMVMSLQHRAIQTYTTSYITAETGAGVSVGNLAFFTLLLGGSLSSLWAGDLSDRFNRELLGVGAAVATGVLVAGTLVVAQVLGGLPLELLIVILAIWFAVIGVMMYASYPVKNALISEKADKEFSGSLFGIIQTASAIGSAAGPALFGALATQWGVIAAFPAIAGASAVLAILFAMLMWFG